MIHLWERMIHLFAHKFSSVYGESAIDKENNLTEAAKTWASGLRGLTGEQIAGGLRECIASSDEWPPSLPAFVSMCKGASNEFGGNFTPEFYRQEKRPERIIESDENKAKHEAAYQSGISGLKNILNS